MISWPCLLLAAALQQAPASQPQPPTFAVSVESVFVDVSVTDRGAPVTGLTAADFELRSDGVPQRIELAGRAAGPATTLFVLDTSSSVDGAKRRELHAAVRTLTQGLAPEDQSGLLTFDEQLRLRVRPSSDHGAVERAMRQVLPSGATALWDGLFAAAVLGSERGRTVILLFTDGEDNMSWLGDQDVRGALESSNATLHVVGIVPTADGLPAPAAAAVRNDLEPPHVARLRRLAEMTGGRFWSAASPEGLVPAFAAVLETLRTRYVLQFEPDLQKPGLHRLEVRLKRRIGRVHCRASYYVGTAEP